MSDQSSENPRPQWQDYLPWLLLFRAVRPAISPRLLILTALGLIGMVAGWRLCWDVFAYSTDKDTGDIEIVDPVMREISGQYVVGSDQQFITKKKIMPPWPWVLETQNLVEDAEAAVEQKGPNWATAGPPYGELAEIPVIGGVLGIATEKVSQFTMPFRMLFRQDLTWRGLAYALLCCTWALLVWAFFAGVMTRITAMKLARDEWVSWSQASVFARTRWGSYVCAPLLPLFIIFFCAVPVAILGLIASAGMNVGVLLASLLWPLALLSGFAMSCLLLGLMFGWPLMWSTISTEGTDAFDAFSRAYAYVFQRPFHYLFYVVVAAIVGGLAWILVHGFAGMVIDITHWAARWGVGHEGMNNIAEMKLTGGAGTTGATIILICEGVIKVLAASFGISFMWSVSTGIYLLLRREVDAVELDEIRLDDDDQQFGLPAMQTDQQGVTGIADPGPEGEGE